MQHSAFYIHTADKEWLTEKIVAGGLFDFSLDGLQGEIFSNITLQHFINEELLHDKFEISAGHNNLLSRSSSGEQKKALLNYLVSKKPGYIIIDNVFDSLDKATRQLLISSLKELTGSTILLQVFSRKDELLPFMDVVYSITDRFTIHAQEAGIFRSQANPIVHNNFPGTIPAPLIVYQPQAGPLVQMNNVSVQYDGRPILQNINWTIHAGEFWQLTGPNGSGKSTLLSLITGNNPKAYGQDLVIFGHRKGSGETVWELKQKIGYFTPMMALQFERQDSIEQMIISGFFDSVGLYTKPSDIQVQLAREWLSVIGMTGDKNLPFRMFPDGQQRMILIARAMVKHPPLLILDEPTAGLDDDMAAIFIALINKIAAATTSAILYVSHKEEAGLNPDRVFELIPSLTGSTGKISR